VKGISTGMLRIAAAAIWLLASAASSARAEDAPCSVPEGLALNDMALPESKAQLAAGKRLVVLVVGGASIGGTAAGGRSYSLPMRTEARLRAALPGKEIAVVTHAIEGGKTRLAADQMAAAIRDTGARLVVWETGSGAAVAGDDLEMFGTELDLGINNVKGANADLILMDLQYAPSIARVMNQTPYCDVIRGASEMASLPLLHRFDLMRAWNDSGELDLDAANSAERIKVARKLYDCLAAVLASGIAQALR
jgi:hypothetical protein